MPAVGCFASTGDVPVPFRATLIPNSQRQGQTHDQTGLGYVYCIRHCAGKAEQSLSFTATFFDYQFKISYGIYVCHNLTVYSLVFAVTDLHAPAIILTVPWIQRLSLLILTISAVAISWHFYEKPLNDLKRYFPYNLPARASQRVAEEKI
jgi:peptidoglycan/LPS O-acetylase OafA/YrhL